MSNQKIKATAKIAAICSVPNKIDRYSFNGFKSKYGNVSKFFSKFLKKSYDKSQNEALRYIIPTTAIILNEIIVENCSNFCLPEIEQEIKTKDELEVFMSCIFDEPSIIEFDIEIITNPNLTVDYKYSNFRKPQK
jgi:hypothetical protein